MVKITLFAQITNILDKNIFKSLVAKHQSDKHNKGINSWTHLISMIFLQMSQSSSLREISNGLRSATGNLNHLGIKTAPSKSTLSYINQTRTWELFHDCYFAMYGALQESCRGMQKKFKIKTKRIMLLDSTLISLCMELFDWAKYKSTKGAIKLHTLLDYDTCLPAFVLMTEGRDHDGSIAHMIPLPKDSVVVADRGYQDFSLMYNWDSNENNFVVRLKNTTKFDVLKENDVSRYIEDGVVSDEIVQLSAPNTFAKYPKRLRRVVVYDKVNNSHIELITNNFKWTALTISRLYKSRWQIEIFFKELKQHLKIKSFVGTSVNAVLIQIWTALITIMILRHLKSIAKYAWCLSNLISFLRINLFVKIELQLWLDKPFEEPVDDSVSVDQLCLFSKGV
jgi:hypothetical protein